MTTIFDAEYSVVIATRYYDPGAIMRIGSTWPLPGALRKTSENNIFKPNKPEKIPERLVRYRSAVEMQCFRNCTLSSLLLTRSVAPRHLIDHCTSQNAIFLNKKTQKMLIICEIDWREVGVAFGLQCLRNCTLSSLWYCGFYSPEVNWSSTLCDHTCWMLM